MNSNVKRDVTFGKDLELSYYSLPMTSVRVEGFLSVWVIRAIVLWTWVLSFYNFRYVFAIDLHIAPHPELEQKQTKVWTAARIWETISSFFSHCTRERFIERKVFFCQWRLRVSRKKLCQQSVDNMRRNLSSRKQTGIIIKTPDSVWKSDAFN